jgi:transposase-like protein
LSFITNNVELGGTVITDGWSGYSKVATSGYVHKVTPANKDKEALPHVHTIISLLKRWILGTHQGAVSALHMEYYLDEFVFRFNRRRAKNRGLLFYRLIEQAVQTEPVPNAEISKHSRPFAKKKPKLDKQ